ncbi:MAG: hypothetical protein E7342_05055 [Clostridiales bacterium]|nr:hypothetical protein [Clostridiales bacterium]
MKKVLTIAISFILVLSAVVMVPAITKIDTASAEATHTIGIFDEEFVEISFGVISDLHLDRAEKAYTTGDYCQPFTREAFQSIIKQAAIHDKDGLDAMVMAGDIIDNQVNDNNQYGRDRRGVAEMNAFMDVVLEFTDSKITIDSVEYPNNIGNNVMLTTGNHDTRTYYSSFGAFKDLMGDEYFESNGNRTDARVDLEKGYRHSYITIGNQEYHFIMIEAMPTIPWFIDPLSLDYIEADLEAITTANPNAYVYIAIHEAPYDTIYGTEENWDPGSNKWHTDALTCDPEDAYSLDSTNPAGYSATPIDLTYIGMDGEQKTVKGFKRNGYTGTTRNIISKYPQVMVFAGHTHITLNDERSIVSVNEADRKFTTVNTGAVKGGGGAGFDIEVMNTYSYNSLDLRKGLLVQVDVDGDVRITRLDFKTDTVTKTPWELSAPVADNSHLNKYTRASRTNANIAPVLSGSIALANGSFKSLYDDSSCNLKISLPAATDTDANIIFYYEIEAYEAGTNLIKKTWKVRSDFNTAHFNGLTSDMRTEFSHFLQLDAGNYDFKVTAYDSWEAASNTLTYLNFTVL